MACKAAGRSGPAFVLCNRFLDLCDAMDDRDGSAAVDNAEFEGTDVPFDFCLAESAYVSEAEREEVEPALGTRPCPKCGAGVYEAGLACPKCAAKFRACVVTGMPVWRGRGELPPESVFLGFHSGALAYKDFIEFTLKHD